MWDYCSNERIDTTKNFQLNPREVVKTIANNHNIFSTFKNFPWPLRNRQFLVENVWMSLPDGSYIFAWKPPRTTEFDDNNLIDVGKNTQRRVIRGENRGYCKFVKLSDDSCKIALIQRFDVKGRVPEWVINQQIPRSLQNVYHTREKFNRDDEIDGRERLPLMEVMRNGYEDEVYSDDEMALITGD